MKQIDSYIRLKNGVCVAPYRIYQGKKIVENVVLGWRTALAHARKWSCDLFSECMKVEILNMATGEIIDLDEAEKRAKQYVKRSL